MAPSLDVLGICFFTLLDVVKDGLAILIAHQVSEFLQVLLCLVYCLREQAKHYIRYAWSAVSRVGLCWLVLVWTAYAMAASGEAAPASGGWYLAKDGPVTRFECSCSYLSDASFPYLNMQEIQPFHGLLHALLVPFGLAVGRLGRL